MSVSKSILISGAGIAGPALAFFLTRCGHTCTIVERASTVRPSGQQIDVSGPGLTIIRKMGLYDAITARNCAETGFRFVDANNNTQADFPANSNNGGFAFVKEIEIMRGALAEVLFDATEHSTEYIFEDYITGLREHDSGISVTFNVGKEREFDLVVAADGLGSRTRELAFGKGEAIYKKLDICTAFMSIPYEESDGTWARALPLAGRRSCFLRPRPKEGITGAYLNLVGPESHAIGRMSVADQKAEFTRRFQGGPWELPRILRELNSESMLDFYCSEIAQVKMPSWSKGRVVLLGDAGYCPSPITGQGTTLAFVGAYILAGCITSMPDNLPEALRQYETQNRPFVEKFQYIILGGPKFLWPESQWGVNNLFRFAYVASLLMGVGTIIVKYVIGPLSSLFAERELLLPEYPSLDRALVEETEQKSG